MPYNFNMPEKIKIGGPTRVEGGIEKIYSSDDDQKTIMLAVLRELKK